MTSEILLTCDSKCNLEQSPDPLSLFLLWPDMGNYMSLPPVALRQLGTAEVPRPGYDFWPHQCCLFVLCDLRLVTPPVWASFPEIILPVLLWEEEMEPLCPTPCQLLQASVPLNQATTSRAGVERRHAGVVPVSLPQLPTLGVCTVRPDLSDYIWCPPWAGCRGSSRWRSSAAPGRLGVEQEGKGLITVFT